MQAENVNYKPLKNSSIFPNTSSNPSYSITGNDAFHEIIAESLLTAGLCKQSTVFQMLCARHSSYHTHSEGAVTSATITSASCSQSISRVNIHSSVIHVSPCSVRLSSQICSVRTVQYFWRYLIISIYKSLSCLPQRIDPAK